MTHSQVRVATYNIRKCIGTDWRRKPDRVLSVIARLGADVVALQEADKRLGSRPAALPMAQAQAEGWQAVPVRQGARSLGWHGNALLLAPHLRVTDHMPLNLPGLEPRGAILAEISGPGMTLRVVAVHLGLRRADRRRQLETIAAALAGRQDMATVILGDFNEWRFNGGRSSALPGFAEHSPGHSFHATRPVARLDRILTNEGLQVTHAGVHRCDLAMRASDHLPVWADLSLT
ncbi:endonuclease/exonuclease/phosphatase family protein [Oceanibium sediminis]|uniref:endonuclease/exonuclease/phosphatase family protein n=1 Tax=Oceanibium sediminis TaxID=2026339 RepID=UPI000DD40B1B|nr:endonuclease/exonuclease/phosphatase family protein [Oceanibium sediminis]